MIRKFSKIKKLLQTISLVALLIWSLVACTPAVTPTVVPTSTPQVIPTQTTSREAQVQSVEIKITNTAPLQVNAIVRGNLTESCAMLGESQVEYAANIFRITIYALSLADQGCVQTTTPFETTIALDTSELSVGTYTVIANDVTATFTFPENVATTTDTAVPSAVPTTAPVTQACTDSAKFARDVTIPDNSVIAPNAPFTKTWRLENTGSCTWDNSYLVYYLSGTTMTQQPGYWIVPQGQTAAPRQTVDISVGMTSPVGNGSYQSYWGLKKENGQLMPIQGGTNGNSFYVKIKVEDGTAVGNITDASIAIEREEGSGTVCTADATYFVYASITADGPATANYEINSTAGQIPAGYFQTSPTGPVSIVVTGSLPFDRADTRTIALRFAGPYPYPDDITVSLRVNDGELHSTKLSCQ